MKKNANCFVQLFSKVYSNSILYIPHVISFLCNFWSKLHFRVLLSNISWTCICIINNVIWIAVMTKKLNEDNKNYHGMNFHLFYTFSLLHTVGNFTRPYFTCPKFSSLLFQFIHSCFYLQIAIEFGKFASFFYDHNTR
jgi:hypothetical protein